MSLSRAAWLTQQRRLVDERERLRGSLAEYVRWAWPMVLPSTPLVWGWHLDCIIAHIEAVQRHEIGTLVINVPPRHSKPVHEEMPVHMADGSRKPLKDVAVGDMVVTHQGRTRRVTAVHEQGELPCLEIETHHGRILRAAPDHPFLTPTGWKNAGDIEVGETLAVVSFCDGLGPERADEEFRLAGYIIGDGNVTANSRRIRRDGTPSSSINANITCHDPEQMGDIIACIEHMGWGYSLLGGKSRYAGMRINLKQGCRDWLRANGMARCTSWSKRVPEFVFKGSKQQVAQFVGAYFACDGTLNKRGNARADLCVSFTSVNRALLEDVQHLLSRFGVPARIRRRHNENGIGFNKGNGPYTFFTMEITSEDGVARFVEQIPVHGTKAGRLKEWAPKRKQFDHHLMPDQVISIRDAGSLPCRCLTVEGDQSFTIADVAVHNSNLVSVLAPGWWWANDPSVRLLTGSYAMQLATRDATRTRRLITNAKHQSMFPKIKLEKDQNEKTRYDLVGGGARYCFATGGGVTGEGGDILIWDDPHNARDMYSVPKLEEALSVWSETLPTRLNDPLKASKIVVMQRLGPQDLTAHIMTEIMEEAGDDPVHVVLPARYDPTRRMQTAWFEDPRTEPGELLWPEKMTSAAIRRVTKDMSPQAVAAQMDQAPISTKGAIFPRERWRIWTEWQLPVCHTIMVSLDPAVKEKEVNDLWACHIWGVFDDPEDGEAAFMLLGAWGEHLTYPQAKRKLMQTVSDWTIEGEPPDYVVIEDKAAGPMLVNELDIAGIRNILAYNPGKRSKMERAQVQSDIHYTGRAWVPGKKLSDGTRSGIVLPSWAERVVEAMSLFGAPQAPDDDVDAAVQAWHLLRDLRQVRLDTDQDEWEDDVVTPADESREPAYA